MGRKTDKELVNACIAGDADAYAELVKLHAHRVFAVCLGILCNVEDAEDMVQETFIRAYDRLGQLRDKEQFGLWIGRIARNICMDHVRRERRRKTMEAVPASRGVKTEDYHDLQKAVMKLPEDYRIPLLLYYFDGHSTENVAKTLQLSKAGVLTRLSRARRELRSMLAEEE